MQACSEAVDVTGRTFLEDVVPGNRPVVLRGLAAGWPSTGRSDVDLAGYLKGMAGARPVDYLTAPPEIRGEFFYGDTLGTRNFTRAQAPLGTVVDRLLAGAPEALYVQSVPADIALPGFAEQNPLPLLPATVRPRVWIGNAIRVQTHYDLSDNLAVVVAGRRRFILFPPDQLPNLYVGPFEQTLAGSPVSLADIENPDLERFPRLARALDVAQVAELEPGDALFIPYGWWHHVRSTGALAMLVNYWWNEAPVHLQAPYGALYLAMLMVRDLPERQRAVWRTLFEHFVFKTQGEPGAHLDPVDLGAMAVPPPGLHGRALETVIRGLMKQIRPTSA